MCGKDAPNKGHFYKDTCFYPVIILSRTLVRSNSMCSVCSECVLVRVIDFKDAWHVPKFGCYKVIQRAPCAM